MPGTSSRLEHRTRLLIAALTGTTMLAACGAAGATPTESSKSPQQVMRDTATAIRSVRSFHMSGSIGSGTSALGLDLRIENADTMSGTLTLQGATAQLVIVDGASYISGESFFTKFAGAAAGQLIGNKWAKLPATSAASLESGLQAFADTSKFADCLTSSGTATKLTAAVASYNGASVIAVTGGDTILEVADQATPYPMRLSVTGSTGLLVSTTPCSPDGSSTAGSAAPHGTLNFDHWGSNFTITAPKAFIAAPSSTSTPSPTPTAIPTSFHYTDPQARWSATFAGPPAYTTTTAHSSTSKAVPYQLAEYASVTIDQWVGVLLVGSSASIDLTGTLSEDATAVSGTVLSHTSGRFRGYSSALGIISATAGFIELRLVRVGGVVYEIGTLERTNPPPDFAGFIAGVRLTPH